MNLSNEQELRLECVKLLLESFSYYDEKIPVDKRLAVLTYEADELFAFIQDHKLLFNENCFVETEKSNGLVRFRA